jgi:acyl carrier protein
VSEISRSFEGVAIMHVARNAEDINLAVRQLIADSVRRPIADVALDATLDDSGLALDSLSLITLNVALEEKYDITLPDFISDEARAVRSVRDVAALVAIRVAECAREGETA